MARYRRKPIKIEAFKYSGDLFDGQGKFCVPKWAVQAFQTGGLYYAYDNMLKDESPPNLIVATNHGRTTAKPRDYIICGLENELYPCKKELFEQLYDLVK